MKMVKFPSFAGYLAQKQRIAGKTVPAIPLLIPCKYASISPYFPFAKPRKKSRQAVGFCSQTRSAALFFAEKTFENSTARPLKKGRAAKDFLVT